MAGNCIRTEAPGQDTARVLVSCLPTRAESRFKIKKPAASYFPAFSSIIGAEVLDFRVRNGNGYCHLAMATGIIYACRLHEVQEVSFRLPMKLSYSIFRNAILFNQGKAVIWPSLTDY